MEKHNLELVKQRIKWWGDHEKVDYILKNDVLAIIGDFEKWIIHWIINTEDTIQYNGNPYKTILLNVLGQLGHWDELKKKYEVVKQE